MASRASAPRIDRQPPTFLEALQRCGRIEEYRAGQQISYLDDEGLCLFLVLEGCVAMSWAGQTGEVQLLHLFWPGELVGDYAFITGDRRKVGCEARLTSKLAMIPHSEARRLVESEPGWWRSFADLAAKRCISAVGSAADLMLRDPRDRCIATMLRLAGSPFPTAKPSEQAIIPMTQDELAQMTNLSRNSVGSILRDLERRGHLSIRYRSIDISSLAKLKLALTST